MESHENHLEWLGTRIKLASLEVLASGNGTSGFATGGGCGGFEGGGVVVGGRGVPVAEDGGSTVLFGVEVAIRLPLVRFNPCFSRYSNF